MPTSPCLVNKLFPLKVILQIICQTKTPALLIAFACCYRSCLRQENVGACKKARIALYNILKIKSLRLIALRVALPCPDALLQYQVFLEVEKFLDKNCLLCRSLYSIVSCNVPAVVFTGWFWL
jgi:hypothetical protein